MTKISDGAAVTERAPSVVRVRIWDVPTRLVHWSLALTLVCAWVTAEWGRLDLHRFAGYLALGLVLFRIYWGFAGSTTSRFVTFAATPRAVRAYLRGFLRGHSLLAVGHNPAGGWNVLALLALILLQTLLGLFAVDADGVESGPLSHLVSFSAGRRIAGLHEFNFSVLAALVIVHVTAVLAHYVARRDNLVPAMFSGSRLMPGDAARPMVTAPTWRLWLGAALAALIVLTLAFGADFFA